jgi:hypothetical protein
MKRFNHKKLNEVEGKEKYHVEVSNRFPALEDLDAEVEINTIWETIRENIKISAIQILGHYEMKQHKPWPALHSELVNIFIIPCACVTEAACDFQQCWVTCQRQYQINFVRAFCSGNTCKCGKLCCYNMLYI